MGDIRRIRVLWPDHLGLARGKYLPVRLAERGTRHSITLFSLGYDRDMVPAPDRCSWTECPTWSAGSIRPPSDPAGRTA